MKNEFFRNYIPVCVLSLLSYVFIQLSFDDRVVFALPKAPVIGVDHPLALVV